MSDENTETVEQIVALMEQHGDEADSLDPHSYDFGYCLAAGRFAERLRAALERQQ